MADEQIKVSDKSAISMPIRNLVSIIIAISLGSWALFEMQSRLQRLEVFEQLITKDLEQGLKELKADIDRNNQFRIKFPRGELGVTSSDQEQFLLIESISSSVEKVQSRLEVNRSNMVNIERLQEDLKTLRSDTKEEAKSLRLDIEKLKDKQRGMSNGKP
tara:strand:- start:1364 stop:1843 length:480 start_codon:yes stop_codon:yes gene_type:complete